MALNNDLAQFTNSFTNTDHEVANALRDLNGALSTTRKFVDQNGAVLTHDVNNLAEVTNAILQPDHGTAWRPCCMCSQRRGQLVNIYEPAHGSIQGLSR